MKRVLVALLLVLAAGDASALPSGSAQNFQPPAASTPYFAVSGSSPLDRRSYHLGLTINYARNLLFRGTVPLVRSLVMMDASAAYGIFDWFSAGVGVPVALLNDSVDLDALRATGDTTRGIHLGLGDVRLEAKFRLLDVDDHPVGIALIPMLSFPTGDDRHLVGNNGFAGGGQVVLDTRFSERLQMALNAGYLARQDFEFPGTATATVRGTERDNLILVGLGLGFQANDWLEVIAEAQMQALAKAPFDREAETPVEVGGGVRFDIPSVKGLKTVVGGTLGLTMGYGSPDFRMLAGVSYTRPVEEFVPPPPPPEPEVVLTETAIEIHRTIHFEFEKAVIRPVSHSILDAVISILKEHPELTKVEVAGHTDSKGSDLYNLRLSQKRANAVLQYLTQNGVAPERLTAKGYGESQPKDTNETDLGRARNRRVEFTILEKNPTSPPTDVEPPAVAP